MKKAFKIFSIMFVIEIVLMTECSHLRRSEHLLYGIHGAASRFDSGDLTQH